mmetsp:Transcript_11372/g.22307  ORF Transcript_11372/g.22307 Transcript_11372/m.22307 type:complete len:133 (+) Transcript_11372:1018-1416(+)
MRRVRRRRRCFEGSFLSGNAECWGGTLSPQAAEDAEDIEKDGPRGYLTEHQEEFFVFVWFGAESGSERVREGIAKDVHGLVGCVRIFKTKEMTPQRVTEARDPIFAGRQLCRTGEHPPNVPHCCRKPTLRPG